MSAAKLEVKSVRDALSGGVFAFCVHARELVDVSSFDVSNISIVLLVLTRAVVDDVVVCCFVMTSFCCMFVVA